MGGGGGRGGAEVLFSPGDRVVRSASALEMNGGGSGIPPYLDLAKLSYQQEGQQEGRPHLSRTLPGAAHRGADQSSKQLTTHSNRTLGHRDLQPGLNSPRFSVRDFPWQQQATPNHHGREQHATEGGREREAERRWRPWHRSRSVVVVTRACLRFSAPHPTCLSGQAMGRHGGLTCPHHL